jgi:hypothetical protein
MSVNRRLAGASPALVLLLILLTVGACRDTPSLVSWSAAELVEELVILEKRGRELDTAAARQLLEEFARRVIHASIEVPDGAVMSVYQRDRDWLTRPYFALNYDREGYVYLEEIDSDFQADLARHPHWASVAHTIGGRQLMFEMALDRTSFELLRVGCRIDSRCELAAVIRGGKSVYCRARVTKILSCEGVTEEPQ